ncbi:MAG: choice-of-anchor D domain-containing protein [Rhodobiaceae bacterium]|nr:choice-of-anchor D domain-containing protein [Rhodobiaceae bacterium]
MSSVKFGSGLFEKAFTRGFAVAVFLSVLSAGIAHATPEIAVTGNGSNIISDPFGSSPSVSRDTDFGQVSVAGGTDTHTFTITNSGTTPLTLSGSPRVSLSGTHVSDYTLVSDAASTVAANGGTTTFSIRFDPSAEGDRFATVTIANNDGNENPFSFSITGEGTAPEIQVSGGGVLNLDFVIADGDTTPSTADHTDFGVTDVAAGQARRTFTITNFGEDALLLPSGAILSGPHAADFTIVSQPAASVSGGGFSFTTVTVEFDPSAVGIRTATLTIPNNDADESPFDFALQGTGSIMAPEISVTGNGVDVVFSTGNSGLTTANGTDFGTVANNGTIVDRTFVIANTGTAPLNLGANAVSIFGLSAVFSVAVQPASVVAPGQTTSFTLRFTSQQGVYGTNAIIANDDGDESPYYFAISAIGAASLPEINVTGDGEGNGNDQDIVDGDTSPSLSDGTDFGTIFVGGSAESRIFTIHNTGTAPLNIGSAVLSGADAGLFSIVLTPSGTVAAGDTTLVAVQLTPTTDGVKTATLTINSDDGDEAAYNFILTGTGAGGPDIDVTGNGNTITSGDVTPSVSDNTDFGNLAVGASPLDLSFMIQNNGLLILNLGADAVTISGPDASDFSVLTQPPTTINNVNSGDTQPFVLRFNPSSAGVKNATVSIASNDFDENPFTFAMRGIATGTPEINVLRGSTNIPDDPANDPSAIISTNFGVGFPGATTKIYTIENTGTGPLTLGANAVSVSGTDATRFSVPMQPATTVAAGGTTTFQIRFTPDAARLFGPTDIAIANDDADENPYNFRIQGRGLGVEMNVTGNSQAISDNAAHTPSAGDHTDFGSADIASGAVTRTFTIENNGFGFFLDLQSASAVSISGAHASDFTVTRQPTQLVDVGVPETFEITFNPSAVGLRGPVDVVISNDDDDENPYNFRLQGTGSAGPEINVTGNGQNISDGDVSATTTDHTDFGSADVTAGTVSRTFTIENTGSGPLTLGANAASLSGAHAGDFTVTSQPATSVAASGTTSVIVQFDPAALGARSATLSIASDDADEAIYDFALSGVGAGMPEIAVSSSEGGAVADGGNDAQGNEPAGTVKTVTYTVSNVGTDDLTLATATVSSLSNVTVNAISAPGLTTLTAGNTTTFTVQYTPTLAGAFSFNLAFTNNDGDESPYDFTVSGTGSGTPEINVTGNTVSIADGDVTPAEADHTDFGRADVTNGAVSRTFTIQNTGTDVLNLGANAASLSGAHAGDFTVVSPPAMTVAPGGSTTLGVQFDPSDEGTRTAVLTIANDDADENPYDFALAGEGISGGTITIVQNITGADVSVGFSSPTPALNVSLTSVSGTAQTSLAGVPAGVHSLVAEDLSAIGYGVSSIACDDTDSIGDVVSRTAAINLASGEHVTCVFETIDTRGPTTQMIADFLGARNSLLLSNQPGSERRINRLKGGTGVSGGDSFQAFGHNLHSPLPVDVAIDENNFSFATSLKRVMAAGGEASLAANDNEGGDPLTLDIWIEGSASRFIDGTSGGGTFALLSFGVDYLVEPDLLIGFMGQVDRFKQDFTTPGSEIDGRGWLAGPYATLKLDEHLYLDVLGAWGRSDNDISPFGTYTDTFETDRWLVSSTLTGQFDAGNWDLRPSYTLQFLHERQIAYTDSLGVRIPEQSFSQGDMRLGPQIAYSHTFEDGSSIRPKGGFEGVYSFGERNTFSAGSFAAETQGLTGQVNGGLDYQTPGGLSLGLTTDFGGIGGTAKSFGLTINLSMPLN